MSTNLRLIRERIGISQGELARRTGIHRPDITAIEAGYKRAWTGYRKRIAEALQVPETEIWP